MKGWNTLLTRWDLELQEYDYDVRFTKDKDNIVDDILSRTFFIPRHWTNSNTRCTGLTGYDSRHFAGKAISTSERI